MYNIVFRENPNADGILAVLGLERQDFGRYRDAFVVDGIRTMNEDAYTEGMYIAIYTRLGGPNRERYQTVIDNLRAHPSYAYDIDDQFDCTYCTFYFHLQDEKLKKLATSWQPDQAWKKAFSEMSEGNLSDKAQELVGTAIDALRDPSASADTTHEIVTDTVNVVLVVRKGLEKEDGQE